MAEAFVEAKWIDNDILPETKYDPELNWNPHLYILNGMGELKQEVWYNQYSVAEYKNKLVGRRVNSIENESMSSFSGTTTPASSVHIKGCVMLERRRIIGQFWQSFDLKQFPADVQQLTISLSTTKYANEIELIHSRVRA